MGKELSSGTTPTASGGLTLACDEMSEIRPKPSGPSNGRGQETWQLCSRRDAERAESLHAQPGGFMQDVMRVSTSCPWRNAGGDRNMVTSRVSRPSLSPAERVVSCFRQIASRAAKEAKLPAAASIHTGPELSAREASKIPATSRVVLIPFIFAPACLSVPLALEERLTSPSDKPCLPRRRAGEVRADTSSKSAITLSRRKGEEDIEMTRISTLPSLSRRRAGEVRGGAS